MVLFLTGNSIEFYRKYFMNEIDGPKKKGIRK